MTIKDDCGNDNEGKMRKSIGIEIGSDFVRAIVVNKLRGKIKIVKFLKENWNWKDNDELPDSLKGILKEGKSPLYLSIPKSLTFFRKVSFPFKNRKKILLAIPYEIEESLPLPLEQINFDFCIIARRRLTQINADNTFGHCEPFTCHSEAQPKNLVQDRLREAISKQEKNKTEVMVVAVSRELIKKVLNPFEKLGAKIVSLESSSTVLFNLHPPQSLPSREGRNFLLLNLDEKGALLDVIQDKVLVDSRSISFGDKLDKEKLSNEIFLIKKAFFGQRALEGIFLLGDVHQALEDELKEKFGVPCIQLNLQKVFKISNSFNPEFSFALGLSLKNFIRFPLSINLLKGSHSLNKIEKKIKRFLPKKNALIFFGIILFLLGASSPFFSLKKKQRKEKLLKKEMRAISQEIFPPAYNLQGQASASSRDTLPLKELKRRLKLKGEGSEKIGLLLEKEKSPLETLKRVSNIIPKDLKIEVRSIAIDRKTIAVVANLPSLREIDQLKKILQSATGFEEMKIGETRLNKKKGTVEFSFNLKIRN